jgi:hypothetical protein
MLPALTSSLTPLGYGRMSVSFKHPKAKALLTTLTAASHRFYIHFGEDHCRLSSDQPILEVPDTKRSLSLAILSNTLLFGLPNEFESKFESLWVDQLAYASPLCKHVAGTVEELHHMMSWVSWFFTGSSILADLSSKLLALLM